MTIDPSKLKDGEGPPKPKLEGDAAASDSGAPEPKKTAGETAKPAKPAKPEKPPKHAESWAETAQTIGIALLIALVFRSFLFQPFNIPSESMKPTLLVGDFLFVSKYSYGYSRHSLPFSLPLIPGRIFFSPPKRGDVVVFKTPADNRTDLIKRVIGLPGDEIQVTRGVLYINGTAVPRRDLGPYVSTDPRTGVPTTGTLYEETLPNGVSYTTLDLGRSDEDDTDVFKVPAGHYFMMGDNRDNSADSRIPTLYGGVGYVPAENLEGKAQIFFFSIDVPKEAWQIWKYPLGIRFGRIFHTIR
jgi:signal peptidase I